MKNRYWDRTGLLQANYDRMEAGAFEYTLATEKVFHSYYRYYNDGDLPGWARSRWDLTRLGQWGRELNSRGEEEFERRVSERIQIEYRRFEKSLG